MNNLKKYNLKAAILLLFIVTSFAATAQERHRIFNFKKGSEYQTDVLINSKVVVQRGKQVLNLSTVSTATKLFKVTLANDKGYTFNVRIKNMDNVVDALGQKLHYNSEMKNDSTSSIIRALDFMMNKPIDVSVNKNGVIQSYTDYKAEMATDTLVSFVGLQPEVFEKGTLLSIIADITYNPGLKKGYTWSDSVQVDKQKLVSKFWIEDINENTSIIKFSSNITGQLINSNTNGTYVVDNATGLLLEKILYIISSGYQISASGVVYAVSRSTSISQKTKQIK